MIKSKLIPISSVLKDIYLLLDESEVLEDLVMEFAIRGMEHLSTYQTYEKAVCVLPIQNSQASYPHGMYGIHSVMGNCNLINKDVQYVTTTTTIQPEAIDRNGIITIRKSQTPTVIHKILDFNSVNFIHSGWQYLSISNNSWDKSIICKNSINLSSNCDNWFIPDNANNRFIVSFDNGYIAVSYLRFPQNEDGEFLIVDNPLVTEALEAYVFSKIYQRKWHQSIQGSQNKYEHYLNKWQQLSVAATNELLLPSLPEYVNMAKDNTFFKDYSPNKIYGGYGHEVTNFR